MKSYSLPFVAAFVGCGLLSLGVTNLFADTKTNAKPSKASAPAVQPGGATPEELLKQISGYCTTGDFTNLLRCFDTSTKAREIAAKSFLVNLETAKAKADLRDALLKKFSAEQVSQLSDNYVMPVGLDPLKRFAQAFQGAKITAKGDEASATFGDRPQTPLNMVKKDKRWLAVRELANLGEENTAEALDTMEANRYLGLGIRDSLKIVAEFKSIEEADKRITETVDKQVAVFWKEQEARAKK